MVHLVKILNADTIHLRNGVHALACLTHMWHPFEGLDSMFLFLFKINNVTLVQPRMAVNLIISGQFPP